MLRGAGTRARTVDLLITNQLLYQLSYTGVIHTALRGLPSAAIGYTGFMAWLHEGCKSD